MPRERRNCHCRKRSLCFAPACGLRRDPRQREGLMKFGLIGLLMLAAAPAALAAEPAAPPEIPYDSDVNFIKMPQNMYLGEVSGVAVNSQGHVFVFHRGNATGPAYGATAAQLLEFDQNGNYVREIGRNLYAWSFAHTVRVDKDDNVWVADKGSDMVIKFQMPAGKSALAVRREPPAPPPAGTPRHNHNG